MKMNRILCMKKCLLAHFVRNISSEILKNELNNCIRKEIEEYWAKRLLCSHGSKQFYVSTVCSGEVLSNDVHLQLIGDSINRYLQMNDHQVHHTIYWQFQHAVTNENNSQYFSRLKKLFLDTKHDLEQFHLLTAEDELLKDSLNYKERCQYLFLKLFNTGMVYTKKTIIKNDVLGKLSTNEPNKPVQIFNSWFLKTSKFVQVLNEYSSCKTDIFSDDLRAWISKLDGYSFDFSTETSEILNIWVQNLSVIPQAEFIAIKPHSLFDVIYKETKDSNGKLQIEVVNSFTLKKLPIYVTEDVEYPFGRDTYLGVPAVSERDREFAEKVGLKLHAANLAPCSSDSILSLAEKMGIELNPVYSKLTDWLISRNDSSGILIPVVHCNSCGIQLVPMSELPISLPSLCEYENNESTETSNWTSTTCPKCGGKAEREKSSFDPLFHFCLTNFRQDEWKIFQPIDLHISGGNKALLQSYYNRFLLFIMYSQGLLPEAKPSKKLLFGGTLPDETVAETNNNQLLKLQEVSDKAKSKITNEILTPVFRHSSNTINLLDEVEEYGCDATRLFTCFSSSNQHFQFNPNVRTEMLTWQCNLWLTLREFLKIRERPLAFISPWLDKDVEDKKLREIRNECVRLATFHYSVTHDLNACIIALRKLTNKLRTYTKEARKLSFEYEKSLSALIIMLTPLMPHFAATLWKAFSSAEGRLIAEDDGIEWNKTVVQQKWPMVDGEYEIPITLRINSDIILTGGSVQCDKICTLTVDEALEIAKNNRAVRKFLRQNRISKVYLQSFPKLHVELIITSEIKASSKDDNIKKSSCY